MTESEGTEVWRGGVNSWECDEMGHLNTRFYVARCMEGLSVLMAMAGLGGSAATLQPELHIRFHREAREATPLYMVGGFERNGADDAGLVFLLRHSGDDTLAATFRVALKQVAPDGSPMPWPNDFREQADRLALVPPPESLPRSVGDGPPPAREYLATTHTRIAMGCIDAADCDTAGRLSQQKFVGAVSDGIRQLTAPLREIVAAHADPKPANIGGAVLEMRAMHLGAPKVGDVFEVRSAFLRADARTLRLEHWLADPLTGTRWAYLESTAIVFDLDRRKIVGITDAAREALRPLGFGI